MVTVETVKMELVNKDQEAMKKAFGQDLSQVFQTLKLLSNY